MPQRLNGVEVGSAAGGIQAKYYCDSDREAKGDNDGPVGDDGGDVQVVVAKLGKAPAAHNTDGAANKTKDKSLDKKLDGDVDLRGAEGTANANFVCALGDCRQHYVHDANTANEERDTGDI